MGLGPGKTPTTIGSDPDKVSQLAMLREKMVWLRETH